MKASQFMQFMYLTPIGVRPWHFLHPESRHDLARAEAILGLSGHGFTTSGKMLRPEMDVHFRS